MASPLILKIQAQLERRGFDDVRRQIDRLKSAVSDLGDNFKNLDTQSARALENFIKIGTVITLGNLIKVGIEQERVVTQLAISLTDLGIDADITAAAIQNLTTEMAKNSLFSRRELLESFVSLFRGTQSLALSSNDLAVAQEISTRSGVSLAASTNALALANRGLGDSLASLIDLSAAEIEAERRAGTLRDALVRDFPVGQATGQEINTISGAFERLNNRVAATFDQVANDLRLTIKPETDFIIEQINLITDLSGNLLRRTALNLAGTFGTIANPFVGIERNLGDIIVETEAAATRAAILNERYKSINATLFTTTGERRKILTTFVQEEAALNITKDFLDENLSVVRETLAAKLSAGDADDEELTKLIEREKSLTNLSNQERRARAELADAEKITAVIRDTTLESELRNFELLTTSRTELRRREFSEELRLLDLVDQTKLNNGDSLAVFQARQINTRIQLLRLEQRVVVESITDEINTRRQLAALLQAPTIAVDETTSLEERGRALDNLVATRAENLRLINQEEIGALTILEIERRAAGLTEQDTEIRNRRAIIEAQALAARLDAQRQFIASASEIGVLPGRADIQARAEAEVETLLRRQTVIRNTQRRQDQEQIQDKNTLLNVERSIAAEIEKGEAADEGGARLARLLEEQQRLKESIDDAILPSRAQDIENFVTEIERKLEIPDINVNFNLDRIELLEDFRRIVSEQLALRDRQAERTAGAPSGVGVEDA